MRNYSAYRMCHVRLKQLITCVLAVFLGLNVQAQDSLYRTAITVDVDTIKYEEAIYIAVNIEDAYQDSNTYNTQSAALLFTQEISLEHVIFKQSVITYQDTTLADLIQRVLSPELVEIKQVNDDTIQRDEYFEGVGINYLGAHIFGFSYGTWEYYAGGMHGYGQDGGYYFDARTESIFDFDDVFQESIYPFIQERIKMAIRSEFDGWFFNEAEVDSIARENYMIDDYNYDFFEEGLTISCPMYRSLFGWIEMGYNYFGFDISWEELKPYLKPRNPLEKMLE